MNTKRLFLGILAAFVVFFATDFLVHGVWMVSDYKATAALWRTDAEMAARLPWMLAAHFLFAIAFVIVWARGFAERACLASACLYGLLIGLLYQSATLITYVVSPLPAHIAVKWFVAGLIQTVLVGFVTFYTYKPSVASSQGAAQSAQVEPTLKQGRI